jgi:hypothetical protein
MAMLPTQANAHPFIAAISLVFLNYMSDKTGGLDYTARVQVNEARNVRVRYLVADSITSKKGISYAGQTVGRRRFPQRASILMMLHYSGAVTLNRTVSCVASRRRKPSNVLAEFALSWSRHLEWRWFSSPLSL